MSNKPEAGLTSREARRRLAAAGSEVTGSNRRRSIIRILREVFSEPIFLLMLAAGGLYFVMGSAVDGAILMGFVLIIMVMTIVQERHTERVLELLRDLASPRATVVRDGLEQRIPNREVVRGDLMLLSEGDRIVADAVVIEAHEFATDESILTGESGWVPKLEAGLLVLSGTMVVRGQARVRVTAAGRATRFGQIGQTLESIAPEPSPLTRSIERLTLRLAWLGGGISLVFALIYGLRSESWLNGILSGLTLAMALLPQEFPVILIVFFALGARRMALAGVLTRRLNAIELLGKITVLCVDKTGTLTENRMSLVSLYTQGAALTLADDRATELPPSSRLLLDYAVLASETEPRDPMELAIHSLAALNLGLEQRQASPLKLVKEYHLSPGLMAMTHLWRGTAGEPDLVAAKGAPEAIARLCSLSESQQGQMIVAASQMAAQGLRVLAVARAQHSTAEPWPDSQTSFNFEWLGLLGLMDPLRAEVPATIAECQRAGIRVVMITGDHPVTAKAIARQAGIAESDVYARVTPTDKLAIIQRLKSEGEVVAMTGDGVNDAPALKAAQIGIAMGRRGTDVARAAAALVLLQDSFAAIVTAIRAGRLITINIKQALGYSLSLHLPIIILSFMPGILNQPLILLPIHIVVFGTCL